MVGRLNSGLANENFCGRTFIFRSDWKRKNRSVEVIQGIFSYFLFAAEFYFMLLVLISTILTANAPSLVSNVLLKRE